ncbi:MAG: ABC transporter substrate-binding protein [Deltaproteobacteria bacterium]|nr:MAG: ABC transporter substrate-binding protein [Deltaproteobacteria bacterium]
MFRALLLDLIPTEGLDLQIVTADTDALNRMAGGTADTDVNAISIAWYPHLAEDWQLLPHGGSVGRGYGPIVVAPRALAPGDLRGRRIAVPGLTTTAWLVLSLIIDFEPVVVPIVPPERVFEALAAGEVDAALLIHEGRLTFRDHGLHPVLDIGQWWTDRTGLPLPLGGNVIRRSLGADCIATTSRVLRASIRHGLEHRDEAIAWLLSRGGVLQDAAAVDRYLGMYANHDTLDYGEDGRRAINELLRRGAAAGLVPEIGPVDFAP